MLALMAPSLHSLPFPSHFTVEQLNAIPCHTRADFVANLVKSGPKVQADIARNDGFDSQARVNALMQCA